MRNKTFWILFTSLMVILASCFATIKFADEKGIKVYRSPRPWQGITDEGPPSSINPKCEIVEKKNKESIIKWSIRLNRRIRFHKTHHIWLGTWIQPHANDGLNWRRGDIDCAVIYWEEEKK